jgi:hypothetical protein
MKYLLNLTAILFFSIGFSQVGINTDNPRTKLEVGGDMKISSDIGIGAIDVLESSDSSTFLIQDLDNTIKTLNVSNPSGAALGYMQEYIIINPDQDWVLDFDTGVSATDYVMITISASFDKPLIMDINSPSTLGKSTLPYYSSFKKDGTWRIIADYPRANNAATIGTWTIRTLIFSSDLSKQFGIVTIPMGNGSTGSAVTPILD